MSATEELERRLASLSPKQRLLLELKLARERPGAPPPLDTIPLQPRDGRSFPLSFAQQRLWFLDQLEPGSPWYNMAIPLRLDGALDVAALTAALALLEARHETLRTRFAAADGAEDRADDGAEDEALQEVEGPAPPALPRIDLRALPERAREAALAGLLRAEARRPFDLERGRLLRVRLYVLGDDRHALLLNLHHIVCDGWSLGILVRELGGLYEALSRRPAPILPALPPLPVQYADFAVWQRRQLRGAALAGLMSYWTGRLAGLPPLLELPADRPRPRLQSYRGGTVPVTLAPGTTAALREAARREGATPFMTLLAAFLALLARSTRQADLVVGSPIANRSRVEVEGLIGFFVNTLVLRTDAGGDPSFRELLARVRETASGAYGHQDLPFELLVQELDPERQLSHNPLFQVLFLLQNSPMPELSVSGLRLGPLTTGGGSSKFDLSLHFWEGSAELIGYFEHSSDLFDRSTVARLAEQLSGLLSGALAAPERRLSELPLLGAAAVFQLVREWNDSAAAMPLPQALHFIFAAQALRTPEAVAVRAAGENVALTYGELAARAGALAQLLRELGVGPDVPVAICLRRTPLLPLAVLAVLAAGGAYVPIDPSYPAERLERMLAIARPRVLLTEDELLSLLPTGDCAVLCLRADDPLPAGGVLAAVGGWEPALAEGLAYVIFTSGSTGVPKGVAMPHRPLVELTAWQLRHTGLAPGAPTVQFASLSFDVSCQELFATWAAGGTLVLIPEALRLDASAFLDVLAAERIERAFLPFVALQQLAEVAAERGVWPRSLREVVTAGEQLQITPAVAEFFARLPAARLFNQYGPSETHVATAHALSGPPHGWPALPSIGVPVANSRVLLLDPERRPVPIGVAGELCIGGASVARGYLGRPDLTAERFVPDPCGEPPLGGRLYRTGDLARYRPDGRLEFLGRADQQLKIRGFRVEPGEIEAVLAACPGVREAVVVARTEAGSVARRLVAYVVAQAEGAAPDGAEFRAWVRERLPDYMVPALFVPLDALPLTPSGKVDRRALPAPDAAAGASGAGGGEGSAPRTPLEEELAGVWRSVLAIERLGVHDSFFDLGGHSLLAVRLLARLRRDLAIDLPLAALFARPTIAQLAERIEAGAGAAEGPLVPLRRSGSRRPLFLVHPVGGSVFAYGELVRALGPDQPVYGLQAAEADDSGDDESLAAAAGRYLRALRGVQPLGPYRLAGWSLGGVIAYEMALQLAAGGEEVEDLTLLDPPPAAGSGEAIAADEATILAWFARDLAGLRGGALPSGLGGLEGGSLESAFVQAQAAGLFPADLDFASAQGRFQLFRRNLRLLERYAPPLYSGRLTLLRAAASHYQDPADPAGGWSTRAAGVELRTLPGDHWELLQAPAVAEVAAFLSRPTR